MATFMKPFSAHAYAALRIVTGFLFALHGSQKLIGWPAPMPMEAPAFIVWIAGPIELIGGLLVMIGLQTRWAAFLASGLMAAAYFIGHAFTKVGEMGYLGLSPTNNGGELAVLYCFLFLYIAARGAGIWSVDGNRE